MKVDVPCYVSFNLFSNFNWTVKSKKEKKYYCCLWMTYVIAFVKGFHKFYLHLYFKIVKKLLLLTLISKAPKSPYIWQKLQNCQKNYNFFFQNKPKQLSSLINGLICIIIFYFFFFEENKLFFITHTLKVTYEHY